MDAIPICEIKNVTKEYRGRSGIFDRSAFSIKAVDNVRLTLHQGEILGLVGESGCGKSTLARLILGLEPPSRGRIFFNGKDISKFDRKERLNFRRHVQMVFQDPFSSLNPKKTIYYTLSEPLRIHALWPRSMYRERSIQLLKEVGLEEDALDRYPHEFSGGQRQRIGLARALATQPSVIVADEPTSALDVSIQAQIVNLLLDLQEKRGLSYLFISHDLPVVQFVSHRIAVMFRGRIVEIMPKSRFLISREKEDVIHHPYTEYLLQSVPVPDPDKGAMIKKALPEQEIVDYPDSPECNYFSMCDRATEVCRNKRPGFKKIGNEHYIACHIV